MLSSSLWSMKGFPLFALATIANITQGTANPLKAPRISPAKALKEETQEPGPSNQNQKQAPKLSARHMPTKACKDATQQNLENAYHISDAESDSNPGHIVPTPPLGASSPPTSRQGVQMSSSGKVEVVVDTLNFTITPSSLKNDIEVVSKFQADIVDEEHDESGQEEEDENRGFIEVLSKHQKRRKKIKLTKSTSRKSTTHLRVVHKKNTS